MIRKVRVATVAAVAAQSLWPTIPSRPGVPYRGRTPDMALDIKAFPVGRLGPRFLAGLMLDRRRDPTQERGSLEPSAFSRT